MAAPSRPGSVADSLPGHLGRVRSCPQLSRTHGRVGRCPNSAEPANWTFSPTDLDDRDPSQGESMSLVDLATIAGGIAAVAAVTFSVAERGYGYWRRRRREARPAPPTPSAPPAPPPQAGGMLGRAPTAWGSPVAPVDTRIARTMFASILTYLFGIVGGLHPPRVAAGCHARRSPEQAEVVRPGHPTADALLPGGWRHGGPGSLSEVAPTRGPSTSLSLRIPRNRTAAGSCARSRVWQPHALDLKQRHQGPRLVLRSSNSVDKDASSASW